MKECNIKDIMFESKSHRTDRNFQKVHDFSLTTFVRLFVFKG